MEEDDGGVDGGERNMEEMSGRIGERERSMEERIQSDLVSVDFVCTEPASSFLILTMETVYSVILFASYDLWPVV